MSYIQDKIKLTAKSSNYGGVAKFSSTLDDAYVLLVANNCNNYLYNDQNNASIIGAQSFNYNDDINYETYIGAKKNDIINKIARFNTETINLDTNTIINGNIVPSNNIIFDLGSDQNRWRDLFLSGNFKISGNINNTTSNELDYLSGVTSSLQTQINGKQNVLTAGTNITISDNTINATSTSQWTTSGTNIYYNSDNVGIGTTNPGYKLDVYGDINYTGFLRNSGVDILATKQNTIIGGASSIVSNDLTADKVLLSDARSL